MATIELRRAVDARSELGRYGLQAAIAACHASAPTADATDWSAIVGHYDVLLAAHPSPVVALNRAIAIGFRDGFETGLEALETLDAATLFGYFFLPAARADFLRRLGRAEASRRCYIAALPLASTDAERRLVQRRIAELDRFPRR